MIILSSNFILGLFEKEVKKVRIPVYEGEGEISYYIDENDIEWEEDCNYGGAWIGKERLLGTYKNKNVKLAVVTDGSEKYAYGYKDFIVNN